MQEAEHTIVTCKVVCPEVLFFFFGMWLWHFSGLGCAIVGGNGEREQSKYISNSTAQPSISK